VIWDRRCRPPTPTRPRHRHAARKQNPNNHKNHLPSHPRGSCAPLAASSTPPPDSKAQPWCGITGSLKPASLPNTLGAAELKRKYQGKAAAQKIIRERERGGQVSLGLQYHHSRKGGGILGSFFGVRINRWGGGKEENSGNLLGFVVRRKRKSFL